MICLETVKKFCKDYTKIEKRLSEETKKKISKAHRGKKGNTTNLGRRWYNNGVKSMMAFTCPNGFVPGRIYRSK